jgi:hypothetical protein
VVALFQIERANDLCQLRIAMEAKLALAAETVLTQAVN